MSLKRAIEGLVMLAIPSVMFVAATGKLGAWPRFLDSLYTMQSLPDEFVVPVATLVPIIESVPLLIGIFGRHIVSNACGIGLLILFSGVLAWEWMHSDVPECACLGLWAEYARIETSAREALLRNGVLAVIGAGGIWVGVQRSKRAARRLESAAPA